MPTGAKFCDICGPTAAQPGPGQAANAWSSAAAPVWLPPPVPVDAAPVVFASTAASWIAGPRKRTAESAPKAGFWMRVIAYFIDGIVLGIPLSIVNTMLLRAGSTMAMANAISLAGSVSYFVYLWSHGGQTIGMKLLHMKVVRVDGSNLHVTGAFVRYLGVLIGSFAFGLGLLWVAFDAQKQGWHDKMAGTYVVSNW